LTSLSSAKVSEKRAHGFALQEAAWTLSDDNGNHVRAAFDAAQLSSLVHRLIIDRSGNTLH
jgi:hypothetical protein